jgi:hypothetical protein
MTANHNYKANSSNSYFTKYSHANLRVEQNLQQEKQGY